MLLFSNIYMLLSFFKEQTRITLIKIQSNRFGHKWIDKDKYPHDIWIRVDQNRQN